MSTLEQCGCRCLCLGGRAKCGGRLERRNVPFSSQLLKSRQIGSQIPCGVTVFSRSFALLLSSAWVMGAMLSAFQSVAQVTSCYLEISLIKSVIFFFFFLLYDFLMLFIRRCLDFLSLFTSGWWWASYCKGKNCQLWTRNILLCLQDASLLTIPLLCFLWGFPASHQMNSY